jgi:hypothetical protein
MVAMTVGRTRSPCRAESEHAGRGLERDEEMKESPASQSDALRGVIMTVVRSDYGFGCFQRPGLGNCSV